MRHPLPLKPAKGPQHQADRIQSQLKRLRLLAAPLQQPLRQAVQAQRVALPAMHRVAHLAKDLQPPALILGLPQHHLKLNLFPRSHSPVRVLPIRLRRLKLVLLQLPQAQTQFQAQVRPPLLLHQSKVPTQQ